MLNRVASNDLFKDRFGGDKKRRECKNKNWVGILNMINITGFIFGKKKCVEYKNEKLTKKL